VYVRRVRFYRYGGPEVLTVEEASVPEPGVGELLLEVSLAGVTLPVVRLTRGNPDGGGAPLPYAPGGEVVGRVAGIGPGVIGWTVGQRAAGLAFHGSYAEFAVVSAALLNPVPDGISDEAAVLLVRGGQVALGALDVSCLRAGESVLVTAAASGVGHLAVQLARARGAGRVIAAVGPDGAAAKADALRALGADQVTDYQASDWGAPVDVVLDGAGGTVQTAGLDALAPFGRLVSYNGVGGDLDANELRMRSAAVIGFNMAHFARLRPEAYAANQRTLWELCLAGELRPLVHRVLPLERAETAHRIIEARENVGRVLLAAQP
jgi:NADPH:quinone reductase-like Zn-dependent oxidoreductase